VLPSSLTADAPAPPPLAAQATVEDVSERPYDVVLIGTILGLLGIGTVEIYAATAAEAMATKGDPAFFLKRQIVFLALGAFAMFAAAHIDYRRLRNRAYSLLACSLLALGATLAMPSLNGARRWLLIGPLSFQPVELAKLALIVYLAHSLQKKADKVKTFTIGFVPHLVVCALMMGLLLLQPDLGSSIILGTTTLMMLFMAGARVSYIVLAILAAMPVAYQLIVGTPWRMRRFMAYFNPEAFSDREAYQMVQAHVSLGSGGLTGLGLGNSRQSLGYMPEGHNDFILAPIGEELGFIGVAWCWGCSCCWCGAACARRSAPATPSAATSRSASPRCSACRRCSTPAWCSAWCPTRASRCRWSATAAPR
jgi:cell division protein FtsW